MKKVHKDRLLKLAAFLKKQVPDAAFDFSKVMKRGENPPLVALKMGGGCGTVGCAIGWAPAAFPRQVVWMQEDSSTTIEEAEPNAVFEVHTRGCVGSDSGSGYDSECLQSFFGLTDEEHQGLFTPDKSLAIETGSDFLLLENVCDSDASPKMVAERIEKFVKLKGAIDEASS